MKMIKTLLAFALVSMSLGAYADEASILKGYYVCQYKTQAPGGFYGVSYDQGIAETNAKSACPQNQPGICENKPVCTIVK